MNLKGKVFKYGANVNTDAIIPARYLNVSEPDLLAEHCMEDIDLDFVKKVKPGDIIVAATNFGCGSSREHAPLAIKASGVSCVIASSFARIFFRNAINIGLPLLESAEAVDNIQRRRYVGSRPGKRRDQKPDQRQGVYFQPLSPTLWASLSPPAALVEYIKKD